MLTRLLPRTRYPPLFLAWTRMALRTGAPARFAAELGAADIAEAVMEADALVGRIFASHFGAADDRDAQADYLDGVLRFAVDSLPPAAEVSARRSIAQPTPASGMAAPIASRTTSSLMCASANSSQ